MGRLARVGAGPADQGELRAVRAEQRERRAERVAERAALA
jgi:hypothetical protein